MKGILKKKKRKRNCAHICGNLMLQPVLQITDAAIIIEITKVLSVLIIDGYYSFLPFIFDVSHNPQSSETLPLGISVPKKLELEIHLL